MGDRACGEAACATLNSHGRQSPVFFSHATVKSALRLRGDAAEQCAFTGPATLVGGNGAPATDPQRIERLEKVIDAMQQALDTQFKRAAALQAELDQVKAKQFPGR